MSASFPPALSFFSVSFPGVPPCWPEERLIQAYHGPGKRVLSFPPAPSFFWCPPLVCRPAGMGKELGVGSCSLLLLVLELLQPCRLLFCHANCVCWCPPTASSPKVLYAAHGHRPLLALQRHEGVHGGR